MSLVDSLLKWLNTFESISAIDSLTQLSDGVVMAQILRLIDKRFFVHLKSIDATTNQVGSSCTMTAKHYKIQR